MARVLSAFDLCFRRTFHCLCDAVLYARMHAKRSSHEMGRKKQDVKRADYESLLFDIRFFYRYCGIIIIVTRSALHLYDSDELCHFES